MFIFCRHPLTNDDFRKLLMTPAAPGSAAASRSQGGASANPQQKSSSAHKFVFIEYDRFVSFLQLK